MINPGSGSVQLVSPIVRIKKNRRVFVNFILQKVKEAVAGNPEPPQLLINLLLHSCELNLMQD